MIILLFLEVKTPSENKTALFADIKERTGITATRVKFNKIDLQKQAVNMVVYYEPKHPA